MMNQWFECKVTFERELGGEGVQKVTESYLLEALSFTEAEKRIIEEVRPFVFTGGDLVVANIKRVKLAELFFSAEAEDDKYYRCKVNLVVVDEKSGKEKKTGMAMMVQASSLPRAIARLEKELGRESGDYEIASVSDTSILDVYQYAAPEQ